MDLQISVFLLFILFTAGHSLSCYECTGLTGSCADQKLKTCPGGSSKCLSLTAVSQGQISVKMKTKECAVDCQIGFMNFGISKVSSSCCNTDQCNVHDSPDPPNTPNGKKCFYCDGQSCSNTMNCSGTQDRCIKATGAIGEQTLVVKGCASKSICDTTSFIPNVEDIWCCEGNLCNGSQSVTQSVLFLCGSLLYFLLMH